MSHPSAITDEQAIEDVLTRHYFRGMDELSFETFAPAFHPEARLAFVVEGEAALLGLEQWKARLEALAADPENVLRKERSEKHLADVQVVGDVARATVRFVFPSRTYTDFLQLVRSGGEWKIIAKTFQLQVRS